MLDWVIRLLGGRTESELQEIERHKELLRGEMLKAKGSYDELLRRFEAEQEERKYLQGLILKGYGVVAPEQGATDPGLRMQSPIRTAPRSMRSIMGEMESDDRKRVRFSEGKSHAIEER